MGEMAKIFWTGRSQAVRLPKAFRFEGNEVRIRREGRRVILEPVADNWDWLERVAGKASADFMADGRDQRMLDDRTDEASPFD